MRWHVSHRFGDPPPLGMVTMVDSRKVTSRNPGYCYKRAGFRRVGETKMLGLTVLQLLPNEMPPASPAGGAMLRFAEAM